jgi:hypothetical protein
LSFLSSKSNLPLDQLRKLEEEVKKPLRHVRISSNDTDFDINLIQEKAILNRYDHTNFNPCLSSLTNRSAIVDMLKKKWYFLQLQSLANGKTKKLE